MSTHILTDPRDRRQAEARAFNRIPPRAEKIRKNRAAWKRNSPLNRKDAVTLAVEMRAGKLMYFGEIVRFPL